MKYSTVYVAVVLSVTLTTGSLDSNMDGWTGSVDSDMDGLTDYLIFDKVEANVCTNLPGVESGVDVKYKLTCVEEWHKETFQDGDETISYWFNGRTFETNHEKPETNEKIAVKADIYENENCVGSVVNSVVFNDDPDGEDKSYCTHDGEIIIARTVSIPKHDCEPYTFTNPDENHCVIYENHDESQSVIPYSEIEQHKKLDLVEKEAAIGRGRKETDKETAKESSVSASSKSSRGRKENEKETAKESSVSANSKKSSLNSKFCGGNLVTIGFSGDAVCCPSSCGRCGGSGCSGRPGGPYRCCHGAIKGSGKICQSPTDVGCIVPYYPNGFPCPELEKIKSSKECADAIASLGITSERSILTGSWPMRPMGCSYQYSDKRAIFNRQKSFPGFQIGPSLLYNPVCRKRFSEENQNLEDGTRIKKHGKCGYDAQESVMKSLKYKVPTRKIFTETSKFLKDIFCHVVKEIQNKWKFVKKMFREVYEAIERVPWLDWLGAVIRWVSKVVQKVRYVVRWILEKVPVTLEKPFCDKPTKETLEDLAPEASKLFGKEIMSALDKHKSECFSTIVNTIVTGVFDGWALQLGAGFTILGTTVQLYVGVAMDKNLNGKVFEGAAFGYETEFWSAAVTSSFSFWVEDVERVKGWGFGVGVSAETPIKNVGGGAFVSGSCDDYKSAKSIAFSKLGQIDSVKSAKKENAIIQGCTIYSAGFDVSIGVGGLVPYVLSKTTSYTEIVSSFKAMSLKKLINRKVSSSGEDNTEKKIYVIGSILLVLNLIAMFAFVYRKEKQKSEKELFLLIEPEQM